MRVLRRDRFTDLAVVPAVSVAFLMLAFLLLTATLDSAPAPSAAPPPVLTVDQSGAIAFGSQTGEAALRQASQSPAGVLVLADPMGDGARLARILDRLRALDAGPLSLGVLQP